MDTNTALFGPGCPWYGMFEQFGAPNLKWCEQTLCTFVNEPANAWSNLGFILLGIYFLKATRDQETGHREAHRLAFGGVVMGLFSFVYHATNNALTQYLDFFGMYVFELYILTLNFRRMRLLSANAGKWFYVVSVAFMSLITPVIRRNTEFPIQAIIMIVAALLIATEFMARSRGSRPKDPRPFVGTAIAFLVGTACSAVDHKRIYCEPTNHIIQGHALWHVFSAIGMAFAIKHILQFDFEEKA